MRIKSIGLIMVLVIVIIFSSVLSGWGENVYVIKYAHNQRTGSPQDQGIVLFKEKVEELSGGKIKVEIYPDNQLGSLREVTESVQGGQIELTQQSLGMVSNFAPACSINVLPYLYPSEEIMWKVLEGSPGQRLNEEMGKVGLINLGWMSGGPNQFSCNKVLRTTDDFKGVQMRIFPAPINIATFKAFGANPVPIEFSELYNALQQGVVDGQENPMQTVSMLHLYEVQDYVNLTHHSYTIYANIMSKIFWESLPKDMQEIISKAMQYACEEQRKIMNEEEKTYISELEANGCEVIELTDEEIAELTKATRKVHDEFAETIGTDLIAEFYAEIERLSQ